MSDAPDVFVIENAKLRYLNFSGAEINDYNALGDRNFCVELSPEMAEELADDGWRVKYTKPDKDGNQIPYLKVKINYSYPKYRPIVYMKCVSNDWVELTENRLNILDTAIIVNVDVEFRKHVYNSRGDISAKLTRMFVTIREDKLTEKYGNVLYNTES